VAKDGSPDGSSLEFTYGSSSKSYGESLGPEDGAPVGVKDATLDGSSLGFKDGSSDINDGELLGFTDGTPKGTWLGRNERHIQRTITNSN
jgi:hypothetical protein